MAAMLRSRFPRVHLATAAALVIGTLMGCGEAGTAVPPAQPGESSPAVVASHLQPQIVTSQLTIGSRRFTIGVADRNTPINDAIVHVRTFASVGGTVQPKAEADAPFKGEGLLGRGLYVAQLNFDSAGQWLALITMQRPGQAATTVTRPFTVVASGPVPTVGQPAPMTHNQTATDVPDVSYIDSGSPPNDMHAISIADAIGQHRPALVVFATPAFCTSATCGPQVHAVQALEPAYRDRVAFIHVEVYRDFKPDPAKRKFNPSFLEWNLQTEPWVFLIDAKGLISASFEGTAATDELKQAVDQMLAA